MWARIYEEIEKNGKGSTFVQTGRGTFDLRSRDSQSGDKGGGDKGGGDKGGEDEYTTVSLYVGAAGEHRVESELLFRGYDASMTSVDKGIDIVARKGGHVFDIQVKTVSKNKTGTYITSIKKKTFDANKAQSMYYVFVLKDGDAIDFVALPFSVMSKCIKEGNIKEYTGSLYQVSFRVHGDGGVTIKNETVTFYKNNWNLGQLGYGGA